MRVLILGSTGLLGSVLTPFLKLRYKIITHAYSGVADFNVDLTDEVEAHKFLTKINPTVIINLAGLTSVELCQRNSSSAYLINTRIVQNIASWCACNIKTHLIQISTDHLYDSENLTSGENDVVIRNIYALSKFAGELATIRGNSTILRTNFVGKSGVLHRESLTDWVFNAVNEKKPVYVLKDVFFNPLSMKTLCEILELIALKRPNGIFNLGSKGGLSKAEFDWAFAKKLGHKDISFMIPICANDAKFLLAPRPRNMLMDCEKIEKELSISLPSIYDEIDKVATDYINSLE